MPAFGLFLAVDVGTMHETNSVFESTGFGDLYDASKYIEWRIVEIQSGRNSHKFWFRWNKNEGLIKRDRDQDYPDVLDMSYT